MARLLLTATAKTELSELPQPTQESVADSLDLLAVEPRRYGYPLLGDLAGFWACRVPGNYRITYRIEGKNDAVIVYSIRHRSRAYV